MKTAAIWLQWLAAPLVITTAALILPPYWIARELWRWYRRPRAERDAITAQEHAARNGDWERVQTAIRAELLAHGLPDTPENRARLAGRYWRRVR